jgi:hypothetical protein
METVHSHGPTNKLPDRGEKGEKEDDLVKGVTD